jgi:hypothetical protein
MLELNLNNIVYLMFRLLPIILPSFFILSSIFSQDIKGLIYLAGLLIACFITMLFGNAVFDFFPNLAYTFDSIATDSIKCNLISLNGVKGISKVPLSQAVYSYTLWYLIYIIGAHNNFKKNNLWVQNIPTIIFLGIIIIADIIWNFTNQCSSFAGIVISFLVAGSFGALWAWMIDSSGAVQLQYFNGLSNRTYCSRPSTQLFKCSTNR